MPFPFIRPPSEGYSLYKMAKQQKLGRFSGVIMYLIYAQKYMPKIDSKTLYHTQRISHDNAIKIISIQQLLLL